MKLILVVLVTGLIIVSGCSKNKCSGEKPMISISNPAGNLYEVRLQVEDPNGGLHYTNNFTPQGQQSEEISIPEGKSTVYAIFKTSGAFKTVNITADLKTCKHYKVNASSSSASFYINITEK